MSDLLGIDFSIQCWQCVWYFVLLGSPLFCVLISVRCVYSAYITRSLIGVLLLDSLRRGYVGCRSYTVYHVECIIICPLVIHQYVMIFYFTLSEVSQFLSIDIDFLSLVRWNICSTMWFFDHAGYLRPSSLQLTYAQMHVSHIFQCSFLSAQLCISFYCL